MFNHIIIIELFFIIHFFVKFKFTIFQTMKCEFVAFQLIEASQRFSESYPISSSLLNSAPRACCFPVGHRPLHFMNHAQVSLYSGLSAPTVLAPV